MVSAAFKYARQITATTIAFSSVSILLLRGAPMHVAIELDTADRLLVKSDGMKSVIILRLADK